MWNLILLKKAKIKLVAIIVCFIQQAYDSTELAIKEVKTNQEEKTSLLLTKQDFNIIPDNRPSDYEHAVLSKHVYSKDIKQRDIVKINQEEWLVISIKSGKNDYFAALYQNKQKKQLVIAHRGTQSLGNIMEDLQSVILKQISSGQEASYEFTKEAVSIAKNMNFQLSTTGHSLGALFAELTVYWCHDKFGYYDISAVTFESPGSRDLIENKLLPNLASNSVSLEKLDIVQYLSYPNLVNSWGHHIGTIYQIEPMLGDLRWVPWWYTKQAHSISNIVKLFETDASKTRVLMQDWPLRSERENYFKQSVFQEGKYSLQELNNNKEFELYYKGHYVPAITTDQEKQLLLKHFNTGMKSFLTDFFQLHKHLLIDQESRKALVKYWQNNGVPDSLIELITSFKIDDYRNNKRVSLLNDWNIYDWRKELSTQLSKNLNIARTLLQPLNQKRTANGLIVIKDGTLLDGSIINVKRFIGEVHRTFNGTPSSIKSKKTTSSTDKQQLNTILDKNHHHAQLIGYLPQLLTSYEKFINRSKELDQIEQGFINKQVIVITGRGGVGKSSLAIEYGKYFKGDNKIARYINADSSSKINQTYQELAQEMDINFTGQSPTMIMQLVHNKLPSLPQEILFIFDNVEQYDDIKDYIVNLPSNVKTLITTRKPKLVPNSLHIRLEEFSNEAAEEYLEYSLQNRLPSKNDIQEIIRNTSALPYDLKCISAYLLDNPMIEASVISQETADEIKGKLFEEFVISTDAVKQQAWQILQFAAYLDPDFIDMEIIKELFPKAEEQIAKAMKKLESLSLISIITNQNDKLGFRIHRKLQKSILYSVKNDPDYQFKQLVIINNLLRVLDKLFVKVWYNPDIKWQIARSLQPHVNKALNLKFVSIDKQAKVNQANLYYKLAFYYWKANVDYNQALECAKSSLNQRRKLYQGNSVEIADTLNIIGVIYRYSGKGQEATKYLNEALQIRKRLYQGNHQSIADSLFNIGGAYREIGHVYKALEYNEMDLAMNKLLYKGNHHNIARALNDVGRNYLNLGDFKKSLDYFEASSQMFKALYTGNHVWVAAVLNNIADAHYKLGNYRDALKNAKAALVMDKELYTNDYPFIAYSLRSYGAVLIELNEIEEGLVSLRQALDLSKKFSLDGHFITAYVNYNLGIGYFRHKEYGRALKYAKKALILRQEIYATAKDHIEIADSLHSLGDIYLATGDKAKALESYKQALVMSLALSLDHLSETKELKQKIKELKR